MATNTQSMLTPPAYPLVPRPPPPEPKANLAERLFGPTHAESESPEYHIKPSTYPPWIQGFSAMRSNVVETRAKTRKQKRLETSSSTSTKPAEQRSAFSYFFWVTLFLVSLYIASPILVDLAQNYRADSAVGEDELHTDA